MEYQFQCVSADHVMAMSRARCIIERASRREERARRKETLSRERDPVATTLRARGDSEAWCEEPNARAMNTTCKICYQEGARREDRGRVEGVSWQHGRRVALSMYCLLEMGRSRITVPVSFRLRREYGVVITTESIPLDNSHLSCIYCMERAILIEKRHYTHYTRATKWKLLLVI